MNVSPVCTFVVLLAISITSGCVANRDRCPDDQLRVGETCLTAEEFLALDAGACTEDMCGSCDDDPDNDCRQDCAGTWGGDAAEDGCGTCDDDPDNDCAIDCRGEWGGDATLDACGVCDDDPTNDCAQDCTGTLGGSAAEDMCGVCDDDPTNDCVQDCAGSWGGAAAEDKCGVCDDDPANDCVAVPQVATSWFHTCAIDRSGEVTCWGAGLQDEAVSPHRGQSAVPPGVKFTTVTVGCFHTCAIRADNREAMCWGAGATDTGLGTELGQVLAPEHVVFSDLSAGCHHTCGVRAADGRVLCWGAGEDTPVDDPNWRQSMPPSGALLSVVAGRTHTCGLDAEGSPRCWGQDEYGASTPPQVQLSSMELGDLGACGIDPDGALHCWGRAPLADVPTDAQGYVDVGVGASFACSIRAVDGAPACWGTPSEGRTQPPAGLELTQLSAANAHVCGVTADGDIVCWGDDSFGVSTPP